MPSKIQYSWPGNSLTGLSPSMSQRVHWTFWRLEEQLFTANVASQMFERTVPLHFAAFEQFMVNNDAYEEERLQAELMIAARAVVAALDAFERILRTLEEDVPGHPGLATAVASFTSAFPDVKDVRDSIQHRDERLKGVARRRPVPQLYTEATPGQSSKIIPHLVDSFQDSTFVMTTADGREGGVDVSLVSLIPLRRVLDEALGAFQWSVVPAAYLSLP